MPSPAASRPHMPGYSTEYAAEQPLFRVAPARAFGIAAGDPTGSPTRWTFPA